MMRTRTARLGAAALALALVAGACSSNRDDETSTGGDSTSDTGGSGGTATDGGGGFSISTEDCDGYEPTQGVTDTEITFGSSFAQSGLYAAYADISKGWQAYLSSVNEAGGVDGRTITVKTEDDGYIDPTQTAANVDAFVADDGVFGIFNVVGTPNNLAIRDTLGVQCVPNLFAATGAQQMGEPDVYPWTIGSIPTYATEAAIFATYLEDNAPEAKVGILYQNDDFGEGYVGPFEKAIEGTDITVVGQETYNPGENDVGSQMTALRNAGADTVLVAASALACPSSLQAIAGQSGWEPLTYISATCASKTLIGVAGPAAEGALSAIYLKEPLNPEYADDPGIVEFQEAGAANGLSEDDLTNGTVLYGWTAGQLLEQTLMVDEVTRQSVMEKAYSLDGVELSLLLPGITVTTDGAADPYPIESMRMGQWNGTYFDFVGELTSYEGKTVDYVD